MNITPKWKRRIRIEGAMTDIHGYKLVVTDRETGEAITNIESITLYLAAAEINMAHITYLERDERGRLVVADGDVVRRAVDCENPDVSVSAWEVE